MTKLKKLFTILVILSFITSTSANALNTQNLAGTTLVSAGALTVVMALATATAVALTGGLALAAVGGLLLIGNNADSTSTQANSPIVIQLNPKIPLVTPDGWTPAVAPSTKPTPPNSTSVTIRYIAGGAYSSPTAEQAALAFWQATILPAGSTATVGNPTVINATTTNYILYKNGTQDGSVNVTKLTECPAGYTVSGTAPNQTCNISNVALVKKPVMQQQNIIRTGNNFATDSQANPADILPPSIVNVTSTEVTINDSQGNQTKIKLNTDGTSTATVSKPSNNGTNVTNITTINYSAPDTITGDVTVTGINNQLGSGTGTATTTTPPSSTGTGGTSEPFPTDYNRESTQQEIRDLLKCDDCELPADVSEADQAKINDEIKKSTDMLNDIEGDYIGFKNLGWSNWIPTFPTGVCSPITGNIAGQLVVWDLCPHVAKLNALIGWLMNLFGAWTLTSMFFRRE